MNLKDIIFSLGFGVLCGSVVIVGAKYFQKPNLEFSGPTRVYNTSRKDIEKLIRGKASWLDSRGLYRADKIVVIKTDGKKFPIYDDNLDHIPDRYPSFLDQSSAQELYNAWMYLPSPGKSPYPSTSLPPTRESTKHKTYLPQPGNIPPPSTLPPKRESAKHKSWLPPPSDPPPRGL